MKSQSNWASPLPRVELLLMAQNGPPAMSAVRSLIGCKADIVQDHAEV
jgi:hypothetical protein